MRAPKGEINLDFERAQESFEKAFNNLLVNSKISTDELWQQQVKGIVRNLFAITPPMGGRTASIKYPAPGEKSRGVVINFGEGKNKGIATQAADIAYAFQKSQTSDTNVLSQYLARRTKLKRFRKFGDKIEATAADISRVQKNLEGRQGITASGWNAAVSKLGVPGIPKWITRHGSKVPSKIYINGTKDGVYNFEAVNSTTHAAARRIERQITKAIKLQTESIERWLKSYNEKLLKEALR
jgi:hypothetical protein